MSKNILFISDQTLLSRTQVHGNIDPQLLYPEIKAAQDMFILPLIGTALFDKIAAGILANNLAGKYLELKDDYIIDTLIYYVLSELPMGLSFQFWNKGVLRQGSETAETPSMTDLVSLADRYKRRAEWYAERLKRYLIENAAVSFPEYLHPGNGVDTVQPHASSFTMPVYLGGGAYGKENNGGHPREYLTNCQL
jgi:hypothetical protein